MSITFMVGAALLVGVATGAAQSPQERMQALETALQTQPNDVPKLVALGGYPLKAGHFHPSMT
jgi:cytochrome c-type biogenesis protein CcmH/NrfG